MNTCHTCRYSFAGVNEQLTPILICWPNGDRTREQIAPKATCEEFERDPVCVEVCE